MAEFYKLVGRLAVPVPLEQWTLQPIGMRRVAVDHIGDIEISTVFVGINHAFNDDPQPLIFETLVFGSALDGEQDRYPSWQDAEAGHAAMVAKVRATIEFAGGGSA